MISDELADFIQDPWIWWLIFLMMPSRFTLPTLNSIMFAKSGIDRRNINNLGYADETTLMAESEEEIKNLLMKVKEES